MSGYENMYKTICRVCLTRNNGVRMFSLIDRSSDDGLSCYGKAITRVTDVLLQKDDKLPTMVCRKCVHLLKQTIYFKLKCESTNEELKQLVNKNVRGDTSNRNLEDIVCEYVMFNQYFPPKSNSKPSRRNSKHTKPATKTHFISKSNQKPTIVNVVDTDIGLGDSAYGFDDFMEEQDFESNLKRQKDEYSNKVDNILETMQSLIQSDTKFNQIKHTKSKLKREHRYRPVPVKERNLICKICHKTLANRLTYDHHMQRHSNCKFICDQCGKGFPVRAEMHMHQIARHGVGPYLQCDHCSYKAPRKLDLIEHLRLHTGERPFTCDKCGLTFRRRAIWRNHLVCHMEKQYQCTHCPRKFYRHGDMLAHCNNVHERMYMFACSICSVTYTKTETVRRHMLVKHGIPREEQGKIGRVINGSSEFPGKVI